jgi:uncharacterized protein with GYD domain
VPKVRSGQTGSDGAVGKHDISGDSRLSWRLQELLHSTHKPAASAAVDIICKKQREVSMPMFVCSLRWTDQGIRAVKDAPHRAEAARGLAERLGVHIKEVYLTSGDDDLLVILDTDNGDNVAKFALALSSLGNVRTRTARAWPEAEFQRLVSELP